MPFIERGAKKYWGPSTINNWTDDDVSALLKLCESSAEIWRIGKEVGGKEGTPHLQFAIQFRQPLSMATLKKAVPRAHWTEVDPKKAYEGRKGFAGAMYYCKKEGDLLSERVPDDWSDEAQPGQGRRTDLDLAREAFARGENLRTFAQTASSSAAITAFRQLQGLRDMPNTRDVEIIWVHGPTGAGKSYYITHEVDARNLYIVDDPKNWEDYDGHTDILLDDPSPTTLSIREWKRWTDVYKLKLNAKYGFRWAEFKRVWITNVLTPEQFFAGFPNAEIPQLLRRITRRVEITPRADATVSTGGGP